MDFEPYRQRFLASFSHVPSDSFLDRLDILRMVEISYAMDLCPLQDSFRFRTRYLGWKVAQELIDEAGELDRNRLTKLAEEIEQIPFPTGPKMEGDATIYLHLAHCLRLLENRTELSVWIKKFSLPLCHKKAEEIVRETVWPERPVKLQTVHVRRAALAAWFTLLRQTTGSCFATAPAILIQKEQPERFFKDLYDLLSMGQLRRAVAGKGYAVPMSPSPGTGELQKSLSWFPLETLAHAPGLRISLETAGALPKSWSMREKIAHLQKQLSKVEPKIKTVEELIRTLLLEEIGIGEEEIEEEEHLSRMQMTPLLAKQGAVYYQRPSERGKKVAEWKKQFQDACSVFRAITECSLLRSWEYTIASFCDVKLDFSRWNLYVGLGLDPRQKGGIGEILYQFLEENLKICNEEIVRFQNEYDQAMTQVRTSEALFHRAGDAQRYQLKMEMMNAMHAMNAAQEMRDAAAVKAEALANSFSSLIRQYDEKLQDHFQEIFDPSVKGEELHYCEDSPAGFRLVYKHGRTDASLWTMIYSEAEYLQALQDFFSVVENDLQLAFPLDKTFISTITTLLVRSIQAPDFMKISMERVRSQGRHSPWDYISGGTLQTLLQNDLGRENSLTEISCTAQSEVQLIQFLKRISEGKKKPILMHSPTHAFILRPDWIELHGENDLQRCYDAVKKWELNEEMREHLAHRLSEQLHSVEKPLFLHLFRQQPFVPSKEQFRAQLIQILKSIPESKVRNPIWAVDSLFYEQLPLFSPPEAKKAISMITEGRDVSVEGYIGAWELLQKAKEMVQEGPFSSVDWDLELAKRARESNLIYPAPLLFADTNWPGWLFGWIVNPATAQIELWRLNRTATQGIPMSEWKPFLSVENRYPWIVLLKREEYIS